MAIRHHFRKSRHIIIFQALLLFLHVGGVQGESEQEVSWQTLETKYAVVRYESVKDLGKFNSRIRFGKKNWGLNKLFSNDESGDLKAVTADKIDMVFEKVQQILGMRKKTKHVTINVYSSKNDLNKAYEAIYGGPCRIRAWYRYRGNAVYVNVNDLHEGILAHELAHAIIDNYLAVRPPRATAEILARYVDSHLKR